MTEPLVRNTSTLPGIQFEVQPSTPSEVLPRLDIPAFVGFASAGPVHRPVAVEDLARFRELFGADVALAWDAEREAVRYSHLGPAVEAFFRNGGQRCWVVRVADGPDQVEIELPGVADPVAAGAVTLRARARGSWADGMVASTSLERTALTLVAPPGIPALGDPYVFEIGAGDAELETGDLLQLSVNDDGLELLAFVDRIRSTPMGLVVSCSSGSWLAPEASSPSVSDDPSRQVLIAQAEGLLRWSSALTSPPETGLPFLRRLSFALSAHTATGLVTSISGLAFDRRHSRFFADLPHDDDLFRSTVGRRRPPRLRERLRFEQDASVPRFALAGPASPSSAYLPLNMDLDGAAHVGTSSVGTGLDPQKLEREGLSSFSSGLFLDPRLRENGVATVGRDGDYWHYEQEEDLLGIHSLLVINEVTLLAAPDAVHRRWSRTLPELSRGLQAPHLGPVTESAEEGCWTAEWTAVARAEIYLLERSESADFEQSSAVYRGELREECLELGIDCPEVLYLRVRAESLSEVSPWSNTRRVEVPPAPFRICSEPLLPEVVLDAQIGSPPTHFNLSWAPEPGGPGTLGLGSSPPEALVEIETANEVSFQAPHTEAVVAESGYLLPAVSDVVRYVRVRARTEDCVGPWSNTEVLFPIERSVFALDPPSSWLSDDLLSIHRSMLRFCGSRRDVMSVLSMPAHFRSRDALGYLAELESESPGSAVELQVPALAAAERWVLGYGAMMHGWLVTRPETGDEAQLELRFGPPDGSVCGVLAEVALNDGAWISPGNRALRGVLAVDPELDRDEWSVLTRSGVDVVTQDPRGFLLSNSDTLTRERSIQPINVRRLMILVRRLALREGVSYVFDPNDDDLRSRIRHGFERVFSDLFVRGAFAGATADQAYSVATDEAVNLAGSTQNGRLFVELRFAPSHPLVFLKLRLFQETPGELTLQEA